MFKKALPRALLRSSRSFHSSLPAYKVIASNPVKAEQVQVCGVHSISSDISNGQIAVLVIGKVPAHRT
jgi:hypothetical protein